jgi:hypothetical protein
VVVAHRGRNRFLPGTGLGRWSVGLFALHLVALLTFIVIAMRGAGTWDEGIFEDLILGIPLVATMVSACSTLVVGVVAIRRNERALAVVFVTVLAGMATLFFIGELLSVIGVLPSH